MKRLSVEQLAGLMSKPDQAISDKMAKFRDDPVGFAAVMLQVTAWSRQAEALQAIADADRVAIRSGHKTGKSELLSIAAIWFACTRAEARVVVTATVYRQVRIVLWRAIKRLARRLPSDLVLAVNDSPEHGVQFKNGSEIIGFTADSSEKFAGVSGAELMFLVDEASAVESETFEAIEGSAAGDAKIVLAGNPTQNSGVYYDAFHEKAALWRLLHISSEETPNVIEGRNVFPGLSTRKWVDGRKVDWGEGSALFAVRVRGDFARQGSNNVCSRDLIDAALRRWTREAFDTDPGRTTLGVDPSRSADGDDAVIFVVRGFAPLPPIIHRGLNSIAFAARVYAAACAHRRSGERALVKVDVGGLGSGVFDQLRLFKDIDVVGIDAGESSSRQGYSRRRDELWFSIADWLRAGGSLPADPKLADELGAVEYGFAQLTNKIKVQSKDELRASLGRSPDRADALALAVFERLEKVARLFDHGIHVEMRWPEERDGMSRRW